MGRNTFPTSREHDYVKALGWLEHKHKRPISLTELGERVGVSVGATQAAVRSLKNKGLVERRAPVLLKDGTLSGQWILSDAGRAWL